MENQELQRLSPESSSPLLRAPAEIRLLIYSYLFVSAGHHRIPIRNAGRAKLPGPEPGTRTRTRYYVTERCFHRRSYETTYHLDPQSDAAVDGMRFCAPLMRTSRQLHAETSHLVYSSSSHLFDFGPSIEAIAPFLTDLTPANRRRVRELALYKRGPIPLYESDRGEWRSLCRFLSTSSSSSLSSSSSSSEESSEDEETSSSSNETSDGHPVVRPHVRKLHLTIQGGRPSKPWDGPRELSATDFKLLADLKHESLDWVAELAEVKGIEEVDVRPDIHYCPPPTSTSMIVFAAFSASIEKGLVEFMRAQLRLS